MSDWISSSYRFDDRSASFRISERQSRRMIPCLTLEATEKERVERTELFVRTVIERERPDLIPCQVLALRFDHCMSCWEALVAHPSLPPVPFGVMRPVHWLDPKDQDAIDVQPIQVLPSRAD